LSKNNSYHGFKQKYNPKGFLANVAYNSKLFRRVLNNLVAVIRLPNEINPTGHLLKKKKQLIVFQQLALNFTVVE